MTETFVQGPLDGTGKKWAALSDVVGADTLYYSTFTRRSPSTFWAVFDRIVPAANKYMAVLWNGTATRIVRIRRVYRMNWQVAPVTGVMAEQEMRKITARTQGTAVTPMALDTNDVLTAGIAASHNDTAVTEMANAMMSRLFAPTEDVIPAMPTAATTAQVWMAYEMASNERWQLVYEDRDDTQAISLRQNQGLAMKNITGTVGSVSYIIEFTDDPL